MMPIVDPHVGLSQGNDLRDAYTIEDYLAQCVDFHLLRMVAVQQPLEFHDSVSELQYLQSLSTTRGYSGFPNGVVAYCDLINADALRNLLKHEISGFLTGVHFALNPVHGFGCDKAVDIAPSVLENLKLLVQHQLKLDLTVSVEHLAWVKSVSDIHPELDIIITLRNWIDIAGNVNDQSGNVMSHSEKLLLLAKSNNTYVKHIHCDFENSADYTMQLKCVLDKYMDIIGIDRIMFASAARNTGKAMNYDEQWNRYLDATKNYSARQRNKLFRTNAISLYKL